jgi:hypothetical protein
MDKGIGFNRNILLHWLDAAAALSAEGLDQAAIRARLEPVVGHEIASAENRRRATDILINIWVKSGAVAPALWAKALEYYPITSQAGDRLWLHYGLTLTYYSFFRKVTAAIGQLGRYQEAVTPGMVKQRLYAERGQLGSLEKAVERIMYSLRDWGILSETGQRYTYTPRHQALCTSVELEAWLLACALQAHPADELPFGDLLRLPELFPFRFTIAVDGLRTHPWFAVQRQGAGWDMVRVTLPNA